MVRKLQSMAFLFALVSYTAFCFLYVHGLNCKNGADVKKKMLACFSNNGINVFNESSTVDLLQVVLMDPRKYCSKMKKYLAATECFIKLQKSCQPPNLAVFVTEPEAVHEVLMRQCYYSPALANCPFKYIPVLDDCIVEETSQIDMTKPEPIVVCSFYFILAKCSLQVFSRCGCLTTVFYVEAFKDLNPLSCDPINIGLHCGSVSQAPRSLPRTSLLPALLVILRSL